MRSLACLLMVLGVSFSVCAADTAPGSRGTYQTGSDFLPQTPGVTGGALGAFYNPAAWATVDRAETAFWWDDGDLRENDLDNFGFSHGGPLGFSLARTTFLDTEGVDRRVTDYQLGLAFGDRAAHGGVAWKWSTGDTRTAGREPGLALGFISRPNRNWSLGLSGFFADGVNAREGILDLGIRPFARPWLTVFGDYSVSEGQELGDGFWGGGVEFRPAPGMHFGVKFREDDAADDFDWQLNVGLTFDELGFHVQPRYLEGGDHTSTSYALRLNPPYRGLPFRKAVRGRKEPRRVVPISLEEKVLTYSKDRWFDERRIAWIDLARYLDRVEREPSVRAVALNLSSFRARTSLYWELRQKLESLQASGKQVYVYADRLGMGTYYLASVADRLTLDPQGNVLLPGIALQRTYMRGLMDKLGLGVEEWRYFSHKTAFQTLTRKTMSEPDREQRQRVTDVLYETIRDGIARGRNLNWEAVDAVVENDVYVTPATAADRGLIDAVGRWDDLTEWVEAEGGGEIGGLPADQDYRVHPDDRWGRPPQIAVVYAVGPCEMDEGIGGRATSKYMRELAKAQNVKGVVLRADSPGGDPLPSDLVAEAGRKIKEAGKPLVVSQGDVAASGGYWISMDGTRVLTTPVTITGSIGVIAGWVWDEGFGEKTGFSADGVQRGPHADLFGGIRFPVLGVRLPIRNLTESEKDKVKDRILAMYGKFVEGVAAGRDLTEEQVREIGEGRVWMGGDAIDLGLCDGFGTLTDAVEEAKALAGLDPTEEVEIVEFPRRKLFSLPSLGPDIPGVDLWGWLRGDPAKPESSLDTVPFEWTYLRTLAASGGMPLLMVSPDWLPPGWESEITP